MKNILLILFVLLLGKANAQSYELVIQMTNQSETVWTHESLKNIYFDGETTLIVVENETLTTHQYDIAEIKKIYFSDGTYISDLNKDNTSFVFPNPAKDNIKIFGIENQDIEIFSADGKLVLKKRYEGNDIDVSSFPQGFYLIKTDGQAIKFNKI